MYKKGESDINGQGIIATKDIPKEELIGGFITTKPSKGDRYLKKNQWWEDGLVGRFTNHSKTPNTKLDFNGTRYNLISKGISKGEEILVDYRWAKDITGYTDEFIEQI